MTEKLDQTSKLELYYNQHNVCVHFNWWLQFVLIFLGKIYAVSLNTQVEVEDCISITKNNTLQMSLIQSSIQNMCLPSKDSSM